ncbi:hypothetical protein ACOMHN_003381 [Nucella lapillus]
MDFLGESSGDSLELTNNIQLVPVPTQGASPYFTVADFSAVLGEALYSNTDNDTQLPSVDIVEQPQQRGFRFRYECEGPSHGGLQGEKTERNSKTYPSIKIQNYEGPAQIEVSLVTDEKTPRIHAHKLVGKNCEDGVCRMAINSTASVISFPNLCVLHVTRKKAVEVLLHRITEDMKLMKQLSGLTPSPQPLLSAEESVLAQKQAEEQARSMPLNVVRLQFRVFLPGITEDQCPPTMLPPVVSRPIYDSKAPGSSELKICRMDKVGGCCTGNEEVFLLCEKVQKEDIAVRFVEHADDGSVKWEAYGNFSPLDVHRQYAIVFKTPAYINTNIDKAVKVLIMLQRKSDSEVSKAMTFIYYPQNKDKELIARKKRKMLPLDNVFGFSYNGPGNSSGGAGGPVGGAGSMGDVFGSLGACSLGRVGAGGEETHRNYRVITPDGNIVNQLNVLPATVEEAVKEEFSRSPESVTVEDLYDKVPDNFLEDIAWTDTDILDDLEIDAAPSLRYPSHLASMARQVSLKSRPDSSLSASLKKRSQDDKQKRGSGHDKRKKDSPKADTGTADSMDRESKKDSQTDKRKKDPDGDTRKRDSEDCEKEKKDGDSGKETRTEDGDGSAFGAGGGSEAERTGLTLHEGTTGPHTDAREKTQPEACHASKTDTVRKIPELKEPDQRKGKHREETPDVPDPRTPGCGGAEADREGGKRSPTVPSPAGGAGVAASEGLRTDDSLSERPEASSVRRDQQPKKTQAPPEMSSGGESTDAGDLPGRPVKATTAVVKRIIQRITAKTVLALRDYSETGDPRYLLLVQRHLMAIRNENGDLPLHLAVINSQTTALRHLLTVMMSLANARHIINTYNYIRQTALHLAAIMQQPLHIELLLHAGADPTQADRNGNTPAHLAVLNNSLEGLRSLVKYLRPGVTTTNPFPELDCLNYEGYSPVHLAVQQGNVDMLRLLVHGQGDVDLGDGKSGRTALHHAMELDDLPVAGFLLMEANADVNVRCFDGNTPLHVACCRGLIGMVALLMTAGAQTDVENEEVPSEEGGKEGGKKEEEEEKGGHRHCRRGLQPRDYAAGKDRLRILRMLMGKFDGEDDYPTSLDPDLQDGSDLNVDPDLKDDPDLGNDPGLAAGPGQEENCQWSVVRDSERDLGDSVTQASAYDSGVADSFKSESASEFPMKEKLSSEDHAVLSRLLDPECAGKDVLELAGRLGYDTLLPALEAMACSGSSPTKYLLNYNETYGSLRKLRECLKAMERDDAVQILDADV